MQGRLYANLGVAMAILFAVAIVSFSERVTAQTTCPSGTVAITEATRADATAVGLPTSVQCWNPSDPNVGQAAGEAKIWLEQHATKSSNISCLNSQFAGQLEKMMQAVPSNLGQVLIDSAYRNPGEQPGLVASGASKVGACGSYHNYGLAADFNDSSKPVINWIRANASQFGLAVIGNPTSGCFSSGFCDPAHVQESGPLPPASQCGICSSNGTGVWQGTPVSTTGITNEDFLYTPPAGTQIPAGYCLVSTNPIIYTPCGTTQTITPLPPVQQSLPPQSVPPTTVTPPTVTPAQPISACTPQYYCSNNTVYYQSNTCSTSVFQACKYGCLGTTCAFSSATTSTSSISPITIVQQLVTPNPITSTTSFSLNSSIYNILQGIFPSQGPTSSQTQTVQYPTYTSDTFSAGTVSGSTFGSQSYSPFQQLFSSLKSALLGLLSFLGTR
ncbi:MAG TPA: M15 family metallopeptidase [Candidatus Paceibacterota bacterium]|nr:M15 family metallopeptidase [Candidatus Paceibacterota bacterium]